MAEVTIDTKFGRIQLSYASQDELKTALATLDEDIHLIEESAQKIQRPPNRPVKPRYEEIYRFRDDGLVELLFCPPVALHRVLLVLFAYFPDAVPVQEIGRASGLQDAYYSVLRQTKNSKYFTTSEGHYRLNGAGLRFVPKIALVQQEQQNPTEGLTE